LGFSFALAAEPAHTEGPRWSGDYLYVIQNIMMKDFRIRYRNMSLGMFWSLLNPLVMMAVLWFVFTEILPAKIPNFGVFVLCGLVPYNVFTTSWLMGTISVTDNAALIKRVPVPRELVPISIALSNCVYMSAQIVLLLVLVAATGHGMNRHWGWLLLIWPLEVTFVIGLSLIFSALNVYVRDIRYVVESANVVLFWLVPIFYDFSTIPAQFKDVYLFNPVAALVMSSRAVLIYHTAPAASLLLKLAFSSLAMLLTGIMVFRRLRTGFYDYL
jgi:ABC-type polysaccharide/polyol phosphate export permease